MSYTTFRALLYFLITFLTSVGQVVIPVLQNNSWPTGPQVVLACLTGFIGGLVSLRAYYDGSALRTQQEAAQSVVITEIKP